MTNEFRLARIFSGKKQIEVSRETGIPVSILSQLEMGWRNPTPGQLEKLRTVFPQLGKLRIEETE